MTDKSEAGERGKRREEERTKPRGFGVGNLGAEACWGAEGGLLITRHGVLLPSVTVLQETEGRDGMSFHCDS